MKNTRGVTNFVIMIFCGRSRHGRAFHFGFLGAVRNQSLLCKIAAKKIARFEQKVLNLACLDSLFLATSLSDRFAYQSIPER
jgi:hypothetical protein